MEGTLQGEPGEPCICALVLQIKTSFIQILKV